MRHSGPSPRTRGNHFLATLDGNVLGTIPADAGEPGLATVTMPPFWDHPRGRGGTLGESSFDKRLEGPSPRTRGNHDIHPGADGYRGTIPADAGEPPYSWKRTCISGDHPRGRGGTVSCHSALAEFVGPSPRTRGNQSKGACDGGGLWTIPADAGEPPARSVLGEHQRDHPRGRGGTNVVFVDLRGLGGPSPRTRGNQGGVAKRGTR